MDNSRYSSNGWDGRRSGRSSRHRRSKTSTISSRLQPDFDKHDENEVSNNSNASKGLNNDELDPKTMSFEELIKLLHPTFITDYLQKVLQYLRSDKAEICFPNLAPFKEEFLLKIVDNNNHLRCSKFSHASTNIARQILEAVDMYKDVYKWTYNFESGRIAKNVLVYKKTYLINSQNSQASHNFKTPFCTTSSASAPISLASSLEDLSITRNPDNKQDNRQANIPIGFKIQMLNDTLKFIKDDNRFTLEYPEMPRNQAEFLYILLNSHKRDCNVGFGYKSLFSSLYETTEIFERRYDFNATLLKSFDVRMAQLKLQKVVKDVRPSLTRKDHNVSLSTEGLNTTHLAEKESRTLASKRKLVQGLPEYFIKRSLMEMVDFIADDARGSLEFTDIVSSESRFLECVTSLAKGKEFHQLFSEECVILLKKVARGYLRETWKLQMDVGKLNKRTKLRTLTMFKVPTSHKSSARNSSMSERLDDTRNDSSCSVDSSATPRNRSKSKERSSSRRSDRARRDRDHSTRRAADPVANNTLRTASRDRRKQPPRSGGIAFHSAGAQVVDTTVAADTRGTGRTRERGLPARKSKLIEDMSTPLESDRAERMMRLMGWEGGALGARGEGITEPIIPALHILPGAGLGHVKAAPSAPRTPHDFRRAFLQDLLTFLDAEQRETDIHYTEPLSKREARFVKPAVNAFNDRKNIGLSSEHEVRLVKRISAVMLRECELRIEIGMSVDRRQVRLRKVIDPNIVQRTGRKRRKKSKLQDTDLNTSSHSQIKDRDERREDRINGEEISVLTTIMDLEKTCVSLKNAKALAYSMLFLQKIKEFLSIEDPEKEYKFDCMLNIKQRTYIQSVVTSINKREPRAKYNSQMENDLYREIRKVARDCYMSVVFDNEKFILKKKYYQKRFTNSSLDLPLLKSKDVKNSVIYINGKVHDTGSKTNKHNGGDDDIIILDDHDDEVLRICNTDTSDVKSLTTTDSNLVAKATDSVEKTTEKTSDNDEDSDICDDTLSKDISIDISNESLLLELLEAENGFSDTKTELSTDLDIENDIEGLKAAILDANHDEHGKDHNETCNLASNAIKKDKEESSIVNGPKMSTSTHSSGITNSSPVVRKDLEINNNFNIIENRNNSTVFKEANEEAKDNEATTVTPESGIVADQHKDLSPSSSKRSRSDSEDSDKTSRKYKKIDNVAHVRITSSNAEGITIDAVLELQSRISESIDNSYYIPLLQCHGIKKGGLIYSCHDEKSLLWLRNVLNELDFTVSDTDYSEEKVKKLQFKINYVDGIEKVLSRLELYNTGLNTSFWDVTGVETRDGFEIVTVVVDDDSFKFIREANFSLFAGVDKALFSVVWE